MASFLNISSSCRSAIGQTSGKHFCLVAYPMYVRKKWGFQHPNSCLRNTSGSHHKDVWWFVEWSPGYELLWWAVMRLWSKCNVRLNQPCIRLLVYVSIRAVMSRYGNRIQDFALIPAQESNFVTSALKPIYNIIKYDLLWLNIARGPRINFHWRPWFYEFLNKIQRHNYPRTFPECGGWHDTA